MKNIVIIFSLVVLFSLSISYADDLSGPVNSGSDNSSYNKDWNGTELAPLLVDEYSLKQSLNATSDINYAAYIYNLLNNTGYNGYRGQNSWGYALMTQDAPLNNLLRSVYQNKDTQADDYIALQDYLKNLSVTTATGDQQSVAQSAYDIFDLLNSNLDPATVNSNNNNLITNTYYTRFLLAQGLYDSNANPYLSLVNNNISSLNTAINQFKSSNNTDITSFQNDMNNINWTRLTNTYNGIFANGGYLSPGVYSYDNGDVSFQYSSFYDGIYRIFIPVRYSNVNYLASNINFTFGILRNGVFAPLVNQPSYIYSPSMNGCYIYLTNLGLPSLSPSLIIRMSFDFDFRVNDSSGYIDYIDSSSSDYLMVSNFIHLSHIDDDLHHQNNIFDRFKDLYASDDLVAAKNAQQSLENQTVNDFTGNGSAAVSTTDMSLAKDTSNALKSGLNTGVSANQAFSVFNPSNSLFSWFTQTTRDNLSTDYEWTVITPNRSLKSTKSDTIFYEDNINEYERGIIE